MNIRSFAMGLVLAVVATSSEVGAQEAGLQSYDVELIIFKVNRPNATAEHWALEESASNSARVRGEEEPVAGSTAPAPEPAAVAADTNFPALGPAQFRMNAIEDGLRKGKMYQPLAHIGWTQPAFLLGNSPKFSLQGYLPAFLPEGIALGGEVSLSRGQRLLHLMLDVKYQADGQRYYLRETRRMKSTEKHYLDHPYFGVIALITPKGG